MKIKISKLIKLFFVMFKIGLFTFGGGYAMLSLIKNEFVEKKKWIEEEELMDMITIAESTPGPIAINMATFVGYRVGKCFGSIVSTIGVIIPSIVIIISICAFLNNFMEYEIVQHAFVGINCAVSILISFAFFTLYKSIKKNVFSFVLMGISFTATFFIMFFKLNISTIVLIVFGALTSLICYFIKQLIDKAKCEKGVNKE